jgi:hypothetical protein
MQQALDAEHQFGSADAVDAEVEPAGRNDAPGRSECNECEIHRHHVGADFDDARPRLFRDTRIGLVCARR